MGLGRTFTIHVNEGIGCSIIGLGTIWGVAGIGWLVAQVIVVVWVVEFVVVWRLFCLNRPVLTKWVKYFCCGFWKGIARGFFQDFSKMFWDSILKRWRSSSSLSCCLEAMRPMAEKAMALSLLMALSQALGFVLKATSLMLSNSWGSRLLKAASSLSSLAAKSLRLLVGEGTGITIWTCRSGGYSGSCSGVMN